MNNSASKTITQELLRIPVLAAAHDNLMNMDNLFLFTIVRVPSLKSLGLLAKDCWIMGISLEFANGRYAYRWNILGKSEK